MDNKPLLPQIVAKSFPVLTGDKVSYIGKFTPEVPITPDCIYNVYNDIANSRLLTHVAIDYPDPVYDSKTLQEISDKAYTFTGLLVPNSANDIIDIVNNDDFEKEFFVKDESIFYHYVAITESHPKKIVEFHCCSSS